VTWAVEHHEVEGIAIAYWRNDRDAERDFRSIRDDHRHPALEGRLISPTGSFPAKAVARSGVRSLTIPVVAAIIALDLECTAVVFYWSLLPRSPAS
jgi:hypothetical protein